MRDKLRGAYKTLVHSNRVAFHSSHPPPPPTMEATKDIKHVSNEKADIISSDSEANNEIYESTPVNGHLQRTMKNRHIAMIRYVSLRTL